MKSTLGVQRQRLVKELSEAQIEMIRIRRSQCPDFKMLNMYMDVVARNKQLIDMIDCHLFQEERTDRVNL